MKLLNNKVFIKKYLRECEKIINEMQISDIDKIINILFDAWDNENTIYVIGNGGSASTASHFTADLAKYTISSHENPKKKKRFKVICLTDNVSSMSAWTNDVGFESIFAEQLEPWVKKNDVVVAFSVHGGSKRADGGSWSQNIPRAFQLAKDKGARLIGFSGDTGGALKDLADACIVVPTVSKELVTVHVEGFHVVLHHLIVHRLKILIEEWVKQ